ncbi:hypothetical protein [Gordonia sihwensis]|uniref:hypothetical protein n=1 Tax=Gordonia sihwensis TaxID=173559 RepID=UPI003D95B072
MADSSYDERATKPEATDPDRAELLAQNRERRARIRDEERVEKADGDQDLIEIGVGGPADSPRKLAIAFAATTALLVVVVGILAYLLVSEDSAGSGRSDEQGAIVAAKQYATTVLTYLAGDYADLDKRIRSISTPDFADRYIRSSQQAREGNDAAQATGTAVAREAGVVSISDDEAVVLVAIDQNVKTPLAPDASKEGIDYQSRIKITMSRDGDSWKLSDLSVV